jgi:hypothetical protein
LLVDVARDVGRDVGRVVARAGVPVCRGAGTAVFVWRARCAAGVLGLAGVVPRALDATAVPGRAEVAGFVGTMVVVVRGVDVGDADAVVVTRTAR